MYSMLDWSNCSEVERVNGKVGGAWVSEGREFRLRLCLKTWSPEQPLTSFSPGFRV